MRAWFLTLALAFTSSLSFPGALSQVCADDGIPGDDGELTFCQFGPKVTVVADSFKKDSDSSSGGDRCSGTAKVQGVLWRCAQPEQAEKLIDEFRRELTRLGTKECQKLCSERGRGCKASFEIPVRCGLQTKREDAVALGKRFGCRKDCSGSAFVYCAIYDSSFRHNEPAMIERQRANCRCSPTGR